jgi:hypothetical protein
MVTSMTLFDPAFICALGAFLGSLAAKILDRTAASRSKDQDNALDLL